MYDKSKQEKEKLDVYIHPDIFKFSVVDFDLNNEIIKKGEEEVEKFKEVYKEIAAKQIVKKKRKTININTDKRHVKQINLSGSEYYTRSFVLGKLNIKEGDSNSRQEISKRIELLSATKNYERISYSLKKQKDNSYLLDFSLKESNDNCNFKFGCTL